jgi:hypothetical protein
MALIMDEGRSGREGDAVGEDPQARDAAQASARKLRMVCNTDAFSAPRAGVSQRRGALAVRADGTPRRVPPGENQYQGLR